MVRSDRAAVVDSERLALTAREVARLLGVSERAVWAWTRAGRFPKPARLGRAVRWLRADVVAYLADMKGEKGERQ